MSGTSGTKRFTVATKPGGRRSVVWTGLGLRTALCSAMALSACGGDDAVSPAPVDGGIDGKVVVDAGNADAASGDATTDAGRVELDSGERALDGATDAAAPDAASDASSDAANTPDAALVPESLLVATTDFGGGSSEVATIDLAGGALVRAPSFADTDVAPLVRDGHRLVLERTNDVIKILDTNGFVTKSIALRAADAGPGSLNPHDVFVLPGSSTAFVSLYNAGAIAVVDLAAGTVTGRIDLTSFTDPSDGDGSPDVDSLSYVPATGLIYATLQRFDRSTFPIPCATAKALIVAIDPSTRAVVDLQADAGGAAASISLRFASPGSVWVDSANARLVVLSNGCATPTDGGTTRILAGIESVPLAGAALGTTTALYTSTNQNFLDQLLVLGAGSALVESFDPSFAPLWNKWDLTSPALGLPVSGVPDGAIVETPDSLLGIADHELPVDGGGQDGYSVVRFQIATGQTTPAFINASAAHYDFVSGAALVR